MTETTAKICIDCKFCEEEWSTDCAGVVIFSYNCTAISFYKSVNIITGSRRKVGVKSCTSMRRRFFGKCGPEGELWEPKDDNEGIL